ncbi:MAG: hypothetical protein AABX39_02905 [Nanoarchaeota archaeon]|mgnify:CR=1 FL=1
MYFVDGRITKGSVEASVYDDNKEVAQIRGELTQRGYCWLVMDFNYYKHDTLHLFGRLGNDISISELKLDDKEPAFLASGIVDEIVVADFTLMNLDGVISFLITGEIK